MIHDFLMKKFSPGLYVPVSIPHRFSAHYDLNLPSIQTAFSAPSVSGTIYILRHLPLLHFFFSLFLSHEYPPWFVPVDMS